MTLIPGVRLGHYEVVAPLGAGGMGEVYRARDTRRGAKLLDFGLARSSGEGSLAAGPEEEATEAKPLTAAGTVLGTYQYMTGHELRLAAPTGVIRITALAEQARLS